MLVHMCSTVIVLHICMFIIILPTIKFKPNGDVVNIVDFFTELLHYVNFEEIDDQKELT